MTTESVEALLHACAGPPRFSVAVAESLTCGQLQAAIGRVSGVSAFFLGGITTYSVEHKIEHLGVAQSVAEPCEGVSAAVANQMAIGACRLFGADLAAATTGFAEPNQALGFDEPTAFFAVATAAKRTTENVQVVREGRVVRPGVSRVEMQQTVVDEVLAALVNAALDLRG